jgi:hypothetical protein
MEETKQGEGLLDESFNDQEISILTLIVNAP